MGIETVGIRMHEWIRCRTCSSSHQSFRICVVTVLSYKAVTGE